MMPVRCETSRSRTRCRACKSSWSAVFVATNFIVGRCTASAIASASLKSFFCPFAYGRTYFAGISRASWPSAFRRRLRWWAPTGLHTDQAGREVGKPRLDLTTRPLLAQHHRTALVMADDVERVLADIDADHGEGGGGFSGHGVLHLVAAPCPRA